MTAPAPTTTWVVGSGGLLGGAVTRALRGRGATVLEADIPWRDPERAHAALTAGFAALMAAAAGGPWNVAWCAGAGVTATPREVLDAELETLRRFVSHVLSQGPVVTSCGAVFLASSAGAIYAGGPDSPFTEDSLPAPLAAYGEAKLRAEGAVGRLAIEGGTCVLVGRISNLYGPGQDLSKAQGLISQMCRAQRSAQPIAVYVSLDTIRDYLFVDDAAALVRDGLEHLRDKVSVDGLRPPLVTKILASQRSVSIAALVGEFRRLFKKPPLVRLAASPFARQQARILRFRSVVWPELDERPLTPLGAGIKATSAEIDRRILAGELARPNR